MSGFDSADCCASIERGEFRSRASWWALVAPILLGTSVSTIKIHWRQMRGRAVVGTEDEDRGAPEVSLCWIGDEGRSDPVVTWIGVATRLGCGCGKEFEVAAGT